MEEEINIHSMEAIDGICDYAISLSNRHAGKQTTSWHQIEMADVFSIVVLHYIGMLRFIPDSKFYGPTAGLAIRDISSAAALARTVLEGYAVFLYLFVEKVDHLEAEFRKALWLYHGECERKEMLSTALPNSKRLVEVDVELQKAKNNLTNCQKFKSLSPKQQKEILKCKKAHLDKIQTILAKAGVSERYFASNYKYFSNFVHTTAFSVDQMVGVAKNDPDAPKFFNILAARASGFIFLCVRDFANLNGELEIVNQRLSNALRIWEGIFSWEKLNLL